MSYPPITPDAVCPKCGGDEIDVRYFERGRLINQQVMDSPSWPAEEFLLRECDRCDYRWCESTLFESQLADLRGQHE